MLVYNLTYNFKCNLLIQNFAKLVVEQQKGKIHLINRSLKTNSRYHKCYPVESACVTDFNRCTKLLGNEQSLT